MLFYFWASAFFILAGEPQGADIVVRMAQECTERWCMRNTQIHDGLPIGKGCD